MTAKITDAEYKFRCVQKQIKVIEPYKGNKQKIKHKCLIDGHVWSSSPSNVQRHGCPKCGCVSRWEKRPRAKEKPAPNPRKAPNKLTTQEVKRRVAVVSNDTIKLLGQYEGMQTHAIFLHNCGHKWLATPANIVKGRGCPVCKNKLKLSAIKNEYVRGYEPQAIEFIVKNRLAKASELKVSGIPYVKYKYAGKLRRYHPDMLIARQNRIVEVKSLGTLGIKSNGTWFKGNASQLFAKTKAKRKGCIAQGFKFTLMLMNPDGSRIKIPSNWHSLTLNELRNSIRLFSSCGYF